MKSKLPYTRAELEELDHLSWMVCSRNQMDRIIGRLRMRKFVEQHGKEKCDLMWAKLTKK